jgi:sugar lactone lactonase YvrE
MASPSDAYPLRRDGGRAGRTPRHVKPASEEVTMTTEPVPEKVTLLKVEPPAAIEGGRIVIACRNLNMKAFASARLRIGGVPTRLDLAREHLLMAKVPLGATSGLITLQVDGEDSNGLPYEVGARIAQNLHPVANPVIDDEGNLYVTLSGSRGQKVPVSVYKISPRGILTPFVRDLLNPTGMAFGPDGDMYISSRFDGHVYRVSADGTSRVFARNLGVATGIAFDREGNLYVGDREGTIHRVNPQGMATVFATLAPSVAAFHLTFDAQGDLFVTNPSMSGYDAVHRITPDGEVHTFFADLGRPQGMAFDSRGNLYVVAYHQGCAGIVRMTPEGEATHVVSGVNLVGLAFDGRGHLIVASTSAVYRLNSEPLAQSQP